MTDIFKEAEQALKVAKITLMMQKNTVCYTTVLFSLHQKFTEDIPTAATDGKKLLINPQFFVKLTPSERITLLAHEVLHVLLDHMHRKGNRDHQLFNAAGDYVNNGALSNAQYTPLQNWLYDAAYNGMTTEQVYDILNKKTDSQKQDILDKCGAGSVNGNDVTYPDKADPTDVVTQDEVTSIILRAITQAKAMGQPPGTMPAEVDIQLQKTLNPPLPWYIILQNYLTSFAKDDFTFRKPNRRFLPDYLPTAHSEAVCNLAISVDISSSVSDHEFNVFIGKIDEIIKTMKPKTTTVISFNTKITGIQILNEEDDPLRKLKFKGRGGTAIHEVLDWAAENKPTVMIVFTDGDFVQQEPKDKNVPIIWLIHNAPKWKYPWGRTIHYNVI